jgi:uncharacterized protein YndB with AHSA1/START domain
MRRSSAEFAEPSLRLPEIARIFTAGPTPIQRRLFPIGSAAARVVVSDATAGSDRMGIKTDVQIEINAPPATVFEWISQRAKVAQWAGADPTYMPTDNAELKAGYQGKGTMTAPDGQRDLAFQITAFDPPNVFSYTVTYEGGDALSTYKLTPSGTGTHLEVASDSDYAKMAMPKEAEAQLEGVPKIFQAYVHHKIEKMEHDFASGSMDDNPMIKGAMEKAAQATLEKLKGLAEKG